MAKRIFFLFFLAALSFLLFSYITEYETLIGPFIKKEKNLSVDLLIEKKNEDVFKSFLINFNKNLSEVYLMADPSRVSELPLTEELKKNMFDEIAFLKNSGRIFKTEPKSMEILDIRRLSPLLTQVRVKEIVGEQYTDMRGNASSSYSEKQNEITYELTAGPDGLIVTAFEVIPVVERSSE